MNSKRILLLIVVLLVVVGLGVGIWYVLSKEDTANTNTANSNGTNTSVSTNTPATTPVISTEPIFVYAVMPATGTAAGGETVKITGQNFIQGGKVFFNNREVSDLTFVSETELTVVTPLGDAGTVPVKVSNPDGLSGVLTNGYTYQ